jgi:hypothetical protein
MDSYKQIQFDYANLQLKFHANALLNVTGMDIDVVESYRDVEAKFKDS